MIAADVQKFRTARRQMLACKRSGRNAEQNVSRAFARNLDKMSTTTFKVKDFSHDDEVRHLAYKELRLVPNFNDELEPEYRPFQHLLNSQHSLFKSQSEKDDNEQEKNGDDKEGENEN